MSRYLVQVREIGEERKSEPAAVAAGETKRKRKRKRRREDVLANVRRRASAVRYRRPEAQGRSDHRPRRQRLGPEPLFPRVMCISVLLACQTQFLKFKPEEISAIMTDFDVPGSLAPTGLFLGGLKYMVIQGEPGAVIRGKKGTGGITVKKTNLALIIGIYDEPMTGGQCNMVVERLGDYLYDLGF
ncbi:hypothetical protein ZIOFF_052696 [Zingiber officinale]|uniref:Profilin n=1 Tax=Zingiber officinale TaxID=94328 RepID=A0A8J5KNM2_ZINOF|nr:hypothetical protein ZIOFF_052696 [Zingiber officinale]